MEFAEIVISSYIYVGSASEMMASGLGSSANLNASFQTMISEPHPDFKSQISSVDYITVDADDSTMFSSDEFCLPVTIF